MSITSTRRVLIYKRTHIGDPNARGEFGCSDCMGQIRGYQYDAVIGVGGSSYEPRSHGIDGRITWVGVDAHQWPAIHPRRVPIVTFDRFSLFDSKGEKLRDFAPALAEYFFKKHRRFFFSDGLRDEVQHDIDRILKLATPWNVSTLRTGMKGEIGCRPHRPPLRARKYKPAC